MVGLKIYYYGNKDRINATLGLETRAKGTKFRIKHELDFTDVDLVILIDPTLELALKAFATKLPEVHVCITTAKKYKQLVDLAELVTEFRTLK